MAESYPHIHSDRSFAQDYLNDNLNLSWRSELEWDDLWLEWGGKSYTPSNSKEWRHLMSLGASF